MSKTLRTAFEPGRGYTREDWDEAMDDAESTDEELAQARPFAEAFPELDGEVDVVACNPPYIPLEAYAGVAPEARDHDPALALWSGDDGLDAEIRVGGDAGASEVVLLRCFGAVGEHLIGVVQGLLLPDAPVVCWWPHRMPEHPASAQLGALAHRVPGAGARGDRRGDRVPARGPRGDPRVPEAVLGDQPSDCAASRARADEMNSSASARLPKPRVSVLWRSRSL